MSSRLRTRPLFLVWRVGIILGKANVIGEEVAQVCAPKARTMLNRLHHVSAAVIHQQALWSRRNVDNVNGVLSGRSEEHTSELQSLMRISYAVFCLKKKIRREY